MPLNSHTHASNSLRRTPLALVNGEQFPAVLRDYEAVRLLMWVPAWLQSLIILTLLKT